MIPAIKSHSCGTGIAAHQGLHPARFQPSRPSSVAAYGIHTMRRIKAALIYRRTKNLRAMQLLLGDSKLESTVRYWEIEVDDALEIPNAEI